MNAPSTSTVPGSFVRVVVGEVDRYGPAAAIVLAHIRWRCASAGPGRLEADGHRWWRVTYDQLAAETGMTLKVVRTAVAVLERAEVLLANNFPPYNDKSRGYREVSPSDALTSHLPQGAVSDQPSAPQGTPYAPQGRPAAPQGSPDCPTGQTHYPLETLKKCEDGAAGGQPTAAPVAPTATATPAHTAISSRFCRDHPHGTAEDCGRCANARTAFDAQHRARAAAEADRLAADELENRRRRRLIDRCPDCDEQGWADRDDDGDGCGGVTRCEHPRVTSVDRTDTNGESTRVHQVRTEGTRRSTRPRRSAAAGDPS